eukprot:CAMPEP_0179943002 /NCGR_PEP_ID=MMETSP0983-20121128/18015_1 /TAXON_ID=483367 /ORGANISM="non described non described, Strain CCMP 2436" /LENGTH=54 /DNA_ID=CAMNT_0021850537 /DNA_START=110 /DNA_END=270 /DNA_ORIENTATION=-
MLTPRRAPACAGAMSRWFTAYPVRKKVAAPRAKDSRAKDAVGLPCSGRHNSAAA